MRCQRCQRDPASWHDTYADLAVCNRCCPDRDSAYGMAFVELLTRADTDRLTGHDTNDHDRPGRGF